MKRFKPLWAILLATGLSVFFADKTEARLLDLGKLADTVDSIVTLEQNVMELDETVNPTLEIANTSLTMVEKMNTNVVNEVGNVTDEVGSILNPGEGLLSENGLSKTVNNVTNIAKSVVQVLPQTVETVSEGATIIVEDAGTIVKTTTNQLPAPVITDLLNDVLEVVTDIVSDPTGSNPSENNPAVPPEQPEDPMPTGLLQQQTHSANSDSTLVQQTEPRNGGSTLDGLADESLSETIENEFSFGEKKLPEDRSSDVYEASPGIWKPGAASTKRAAVDQQPSSLPLQRVPDHFASSMILPTTGTTSNRDVSGGSTHPQIDIHNLVLYNGNHKLESIRRVARDADFLISQWANAPPTQPPKHFLFSNIK